MPPLLTGPDRGVSSVQGASDLRPSPAAVGSGSPAAPGELDSATPPEVALQNSDRCRSVSAGRGICQLGLPAEVEGAAEDSGQTES